MQTITFFRQVRKDGGIRTGVDLGQDTVLSRFDAGAAERDPALVWYVDVRAEGASLPATIEGARQWIVGHESTIRDKLLSMAEVYPAGVDSSEGPMASETTSTGRGRQKVKLTVYTAVNRREEATRMPTILRDIAAHLSVYVGGLTAAA